MKIRIKTIDSDYNAETGISKVTIATDCGLFNGVAKLHEEDREYKSSFSGCRYAELKAIIKYMKRKAYICNYQLKTLNILKKDIENRKFFDDNELSYKLLLKQIENIEKDKTQFKENIHSLKERLKNEIAYREQVLKDLQKKKSE